LLLAVGLVEDSRWGRALNTHWVREIFGNPFRRFALNASWLTSTVNALATGTYSEKAFYLFSSMPSRIPNATMTTSSFIVESWAWMLVAAGD
jgi:hypothetical protein